MKLRPWSKTYRGVAAIGSFLANSATNARRRRSSEFTASAGRLDLALHGSRVHLFDWLPLNETWWTIS
jgi:hypothetical protein